MTTRKHKIFKRLREIILFLLKVLVLAAVVILIWVVYAMGELRVFLPQYFRLAGLPNEEKNYLIVFQNNNELRPAGGFITAFGFANFNYGIFSGLDISDVYTYSSDRVEITPPYPLDKFLSKNNRKIPYTFRDANFAPNFPDSAKSVEYMLKLENQNKNIDGVIAVNYSFLEDLLVTTGPIEVDGVVFDKDSLFTNLEYTVNNIDKHDIQDLSKRKNILKNFSKELIRKMALNPLLLKEALATVLESMKKKDIQMYFKDQTLENIAVNHGWSGKWPDETEGDFLALNEANLGGMKSDRYLTRNVDYNLIVEGKPGTEDYALKAKVTVKVKNFGAETVPINGLYEGYFRLYVPKNAAIKVADMQNPESLREENNKSLHVFGGMLKMNPGEEKSFSFTYELPSNLIKNGHYSLLIPKQSGAKNDLYTVTIQFPGDYQVKSDSFQARENFAIYKGMPEQDLSLNLDFVRDMKPPFVIDQSLDSLNFVSIFFNEDVAPVTIDNFSIEDSNEKVPEQKDSVKIWSVEQTGKKVILKILGMTKQNEERYSILIKDVRDLNGNIIAPNPRKITTVQRLP